MSLHPIEKNVVIIGANFAGLSAASKLDKNVKVTLIDQRTKFQWTPNIHEILSDVKKDTSLSLDLPTIIPRLGHQFIQQSVTSIDANAQTLLLEDGTIISYKVLLIASGHVRNSFGISGASEHAFSFRTAQDVVDIHQNLKTLIASEKDDIHINIIGGGFTGVEVLGELLRRHASNQKIHFHLVEAGSRLVHALPEKLSSDIISQCKHQRVEFYFDKKLKHIDENNLYFEDGSTQYSDMTIWTAGTKLPDYVQSLHSDKSESGIACNDKLQSLHYPNIFVAGDSASLPKACAKQASNALDMGAHAAKNISQYCADKTLDSFSHSAKPVLLAFGDINTYFVQGKLVLASPLLASVKEAIYQLWMARLSASLPVEDCLSGLSSRIQLSTEKLLLPEILKLRPRIIAGRSKIL